MPLALSINSEMSGSPLETNIPLFNLAGSN